MRKRSRAIIWGNCQASYIYNMLMQSEDFVRLFDCSRHLNFCGPGQFDSNPFPPEELASCRLLIYHKVFSGSNAEVVNRYLEFLSEDCLTIPLPYIKSNLYWPFFDTEPRPMAVSPKLPYGVLSYRSKIIDLWLREGKSDAEIIDNFARLDPQAYFDISKLETDTYTQWKRLEAELEGKIYFVEHLIEHWRKEMLFYTYNHPSMLTLLYLANQILELLGLEQLELGQVKECEVGQVMVYPVHQGAALRHGIEFVKPDSKYPLLGRKYTYEQFMRIYLRLAKAEPRAS